MPLVNHLLAGEIFLHLKGLSPRYFVTGWSELEGTMGRILQALIFYKVEYSSSATLAKLASCTGTHNTSIRVALGALLSAFLASQQDGSPPNFAT